jgi:hypothetical protein
LLVEAHGSFASASCTRCDAQYDAAWVDAAINVDIQEAVDIVPRCIRCPGHAPVKPNITFFGEELPPRFHSLAGGDMAAADLCLVLGSSLQVAPVSALFTQVPPDCPRVLINLHPVGEALDINAQSDLQGLTREQLAQLVSGDGDGGFRFNRADNFRDVFLQGTCDAQAALIATAAGWGRELEQLQSAELTRLRASRAAAREARSSCPRVGTADGAQEVLGAVPPHAVCAPAHSLSSLSLTQALQGAGVTGVRLSGAAAGSNEAAAAAAGAEMRAEAAWTAATAAGGRMNVLEDALGVLEEETLPPSEALPGELFQAPQQHPRHDACKK